MVTHRLCQHPELLASVAVAMETSPGQPWIHPNHGEDIPRSTGRILQKGIVTLDLNDRSCGCAASIVEDENV